MARCKPGQSAFIKKSLRPANIGLVVECTKYLGPYSKGEIVEISGEQWMAFDSDDYWIITSATGSIETQFGKSKIAYIMDSWLDPIDPDILDLEVEDELADELLHE